MSEEIGDTQTIEKKKPKSGSRPQTAIHDYESKAPPSRPEEEGEATPSNGGSRKSSLRKEDEGIKRKDTPTSEDVKRKSLTTDAAGKNNQDRVNGSSNGESNGVSYLESITKERVPVIKTDVELFKELDNEKVAELKEAFLLFDLNSDGYIDHFDLKGTLISLGQDVTDEEIRQMLSEISGPMDFDAFVKLLGYKTIELDSEETLLEALSKWDYDQSGLISEERIRHDLMTWGDRFSKKEVDYALEGAPTSVIKGDSMIDYIKFCKTLSGLRKKQRTE